VAGWFGLRVIEKRCYYTNAYFSYFFPAHLLWRLWLLLFYRIRGDQAAESFSMAFEKAEF
jgi:hypothetical protein